MLHVEARERVCRVIAFPWYVVKNVRVLVDENHPPAHFPSVRDPMISDACAITLEDYRMSRDVLLELHESEVRGIQFAFPIGPTTFCVIERLGHN
jgi:hypothetical protein